MAEYDVIDEAIINAKPDVVYEALLAEYSGKTNWWMPHLEAKLLEGSAPDELGALIEVIAHGKMTTKFVMKTIETKKNELWRLQYFKGPLRGEGEWKLEATDDGTKASYRLRAHPSGLLVRIVATFVSLPKSHSKIFTAGFAALNQYIQK
jgi:hypothetical protein